MAKAVQLYIHTRRLCGIYTVDSRRVKLYTPVKTLFLTLVVIMLISGKYSQILSYSSLCNFVLLFVRLKVDP